MRTLGLARKLNAVAKMRQFFGKYLPLIVGLLVVAFWMTIRAGPHEAKIVWIPILIGLVFGSEAIARRLRKPRNERAE